MRGQGRDRRARPVAVDRGGQSAQGRGAERGADRRKPDQPQTAEEGRLMPKGYWIARVDVKDADAYKKYVEGTAVAFEKYGARFLARGGRTQALEGVARARNVVSEFDSLEQA